MSRSECQTDLAAEPARFIVARGRLSYKDHGRHGVTWSVVDTLRGVSVARSDDKTQAEAEAERLNAARPPLREGIDYPGDVR